MALSHSVIVNRIEAILTANATPTFAGVFPGEPLGLPLGGPYAAFWYLGRRPTVGNVKGRMDVIETWQVVCYWPRQAERSTLEAFENQIADADQSLHTAFRADALLNDGGASGASPMLLISDSEVGYGRFPLGQSPGVHYRALGFVLEITDREGEPTVL